MVFHKGGISSKRAQPVMSLHQGGKALKVEWKLSEHLFTDKQATVQAIPKDSAWHNGYADTLDRIHQAGVFPIDKYYQGAPQVIALNRECTGNPVINCWCVLTNEVVHCEGQDHIHFNSIYVMTLKAAKDQHTLTLGPKLAGITKFGMSELDQSSTMAVVEAEVEAKAAGVDGAHPHLWQKTGTTICLAVMMNSEEDKK
jgi:hypothetical protein